MKKKMVTIYSPVAEEETAYNEGTFYNVVEPSFEVSRILSFENTVDILEKLRCAGGRDGQNVTHEENHLHYYDSHFSNNMHLSHSYSHNRSAELDFGNQTKERRSSDIGVSNFHSWYDVDFNEPSYEQQHNYSADLYTPSADDRRLPKKYSGMVEAVEKDGTVVPHVLVESRSLMPQIMTPLSPENPKSLKEHHSLLAMSAHMENLGINVNHGISNGYYLNHGRVAKQPPVSYTHLDVYKRQIYMSPPRTVLKPRDPWNSTPNQTTEKSWNLNWKPSETWKSGESVRKLES